MVKIFIVYLNLDMKENSLGLAEGTQGWARLVYDSLRDISQSLTH